jgi:hypothetical protein
MTAPIPLTPHQMAAYRFVSQCGPSSIARIMRAPYWKDRKPSLLRGVCHALKRFGVVTISYRRRGLCVRPVKGASVIEVARKTPNKREFTPAEINEMVAARRAGESIYNLSRRYRASHERMAAMLRVIDEKLYAPGRPPTFDRIDDLDKAERMWTRLLAGRKFGVPIVRVAA